MFSMNLGSRESRGHAVVALYGELDLVDATAVAAALGVVAAREPRIIVDLAGLEFMDASGVAALSRGRKHARNAGGDLLLAAPQRLVRRVLAIIWEIDGCAVHASVAAAVASAGASRQAIAPIPRQPTNMRWQRIAINAPAQKRRALAGDRLVRSSWGLLAELSGDVKQPFVRKKDF
jgi:anti-sigma B factor antagonist